MKRLPTRVVALATAYCTALGLSFSLTAAAQTKRDLHTA